MNLAHSQRNSFLGFFPRENAHFGLWREHRAIHCGGKRVRGDVVWQHQNRVLTTAHEIARNGKEEVRVGFEHLGHKFVGGLQRNLGPLRD